MKVAAVAGATRRASRRAGRRAGMRPRGERARWAHHDPRPCQVPPDWSAGYVGPWAHQSK